MRAYSITVSLTVECDDSDIAMATVQEMIAASVEQRSDDPFGMIVNVYSATDWSIKQL